MNAQRTTRHRLVIFLGAICVAMSSLRAAEPELVFSETRTYDIRVDGKKAGQSRLTIASYRDGTETVKADAKITVGFLLFNYVYEFHGQEQWRGGRLDQLATSAVDGGQKMSLKVARTDDGYSITKSKGKPAAASNIEFTSNYWRQPPVDPQGRGLTVVDADTGVLYDIKVESLGQKELTVAGKQLMASGFHLKGKLDAELWFDSQGLLVHQDSNEEGHPVEVRLVSIERPEEVARTGDKPARGER